MQLIFEVVYINSTILTLRKDVTNLLTPPVWNKLKYTRYQNYSFYLKSVRESFCLSSVHYSIPELGIFCCSIPNGPHYCQRPLLQQTWVDYKKFTIWLYVFKLLFICHNFCYTVLSIQYILHIVLTNMENSKYLGNTNWKCLDFIKSKCLFSP